MLSLHELTEATEKHGVLAYGRMNPPTTGHAKLVEKVHEVSKAHNATHKVVLSHSEDPKKNPLSQEQKVKHAKRFFPHTHIVAADKSHPTIFHHAAKMHKEGIKHLHVIAGDDRVKEYHDSLHKYNGHFDKEGHGYHFKSITVHSAGKRDPHAKGAEGMSASKMREHATKGHFEEFKKGIPSHVKHEHAKELYDDVRRGQTVKEEVKRPSLLGIKWATVKPLPKPAPTQDELHRKYDKEVANSQVKEDVDYLFEGVHDAAIFKAVFLAGAPGSGKDFVLKKSLHGHGLTEINSDTALEHLMDKAKLDKKMPEHEQERRNVARDRAKSLAELKQRLALHGRNGLIINSTGATHDKIKKIKDMLGDLGYDSKMIFVDASDNVSRNRNVERGQRGGRMIPEKVRAEKWRHAQDSRVKFAQMFGGEHYHEFNNDEDLRQNPDPEVASQKTAELDDLHKTVRKFTQQPAKSEQAQQWIYKNMGKLAKMPVGNKKQQANAMPPPPDSKAKEEADKLGLKWLGHGRYGKDSRVTHFTLHDRLIEKQKALKPPVDKSVKKPAKKLNEEFEQLFTEDEHEHLELRDYVENSIVVGGSERVVLPVQQLSTFTGRIGVPGVPAGSSLFRDLTEEKESQDTPQEKVEFGSFRIRLGVSGTEAQKETLQEGEPVVDTMETGGPVLGGSPAEQHSMGSGGKATPVPKKTIKDMLKKKAP